MSANNVNGLLGVSMDKIKEMVDVNTVVGEPITTPDGTTVIPISRVNYGFAAGGSDLPSKSQPQGGLFAGGSGAGVTVSPVAFLSIHDGNVRVIQIEPYFSPVDRALEKIQVILTKSIRWAYKMGPVAYSFVRLAGPAGLTLAGVWGAEPQGLAAGHNNTPE